MTVEELTQENEKLKTDLENLQKQHLGLQGAMIVQLTTSGLFMKPTLDIINNLRQICSTGSGNDISIEEIQLTFDSYVAVHLQNPDFTDEEKAVFSAVNALVATGERKEESLITRV